MFVIDQFVIIIAHVLTKERIMSAISNNSSTNIVLSYEMQNCVAKLEKATKNDSFTTELFEMVLKKMEQSSLKKEQKNRIIQAFDKIIEFYGNQKRKNVSEGPPPFVSHPIMVVQLLLMGNVEDSKTLVAAAVHDIVIGMLNPKNKKMIKDTFGKEVFNLVKEVSKAKFAKLDQLSNSALYILAASFHDNCEDRQFLIHESKKLKAILDKRWKLIDLVKPLKPELAKVLTNANAILLIKIGQTQGSYVDVKIKSETYQCNVKAAQGWGGIMLLNNVTFRLTDSEVKRGFLCKIGTKAYLLEPRSFGYDVEEADLLQAKKEASRFKGSIVMSLNPSTGQMEGGIDSMNIRNRFAQYILDNKIDP